MSTSHKIDVNHVALLARMSLTEEEASVFQEQMDQIVDWIDKINELDLENVEPTSHPVPLENILREDRAGESLPREAVIENFPEVKDDQVKVPRILE